MGHSQLKCRCGKTPHGVDDHGFHFSLGCNTDHQRTILHDSSVQELESIMKGNGLIVRHEPRNTFQDSGNRPDTIIDNPQCLELGRPYTQVIIDHSFTCPLEGAMTGSIISPVTREKAMVAGDRAEIRYVEKFRRYENLIAQNNVGRANPDKVFILPFVFESSGLLHHKSMEFLETLADHCSKEKKIPLVNMLIYIKRRMACCLARNLGRVINVRAKAAIGGVASVGSNTEIRQILETHVHDEDI
jgi:hypothetical protein